MPCNRHHPNASYDPLHDAATVGPAPTAQALQSPFTHPTPPIPHSSTGSQGSNRGFSWYTNLKSSTDAQGNTQHRLLGTSAHPSYTIAALRSVDPTQERMSAPVPCKIGTKGTNGTRNPSTFDCADDAHVRQTAVNMDDPHTTL